MNGSQPYTFILEQATTAERARQDARQRTPDENCAVDLRIALLLRLTLQKNPHLPPAVRAARSPPAENAAGTTAKAIHPRRSPRCEDSRCPLCAPDRRFPRTARECRPLYARRHRDCFRPRGAEKRAGGCRARSTLPQRWLGCRKPQSMRVGARCPRSSAKKLRLIFQRIVPVVARGSVPARASCTESGCRWLR